MRACNSTRFMTASLQSPSCIRTHAASSATSSQSASPSSTSQSENSFAAARVTAADRSLLVRVLNRNLIQQREEANLQSLGSDPLLTSLPAGRSPFSQAKCLVTLGCPSRCKSSSKLVLVIALVLMSCDPHNCNCRVPIVISQHSNSTNGCRPIVVPNRVTLGGHCPPR